MVTEDGGSNWSRVGWEAKHVDEHALWIDPDNTKHMLTGNDGGMYETWDRGDNWAFMANLPVTQFYRVAVDNDEPFYNIYGGTQDNNTQGGPSQTHYVHGISNREWFMLIAGEASFTGPGSLVVRGAGSERTITADRFLIATGSEPARPDSVPFDDECVLTSDDLLRLTCLPETLIVCGGGVIGTGEVKFSADSHRGSTGSGIYQVKAGKLVEIAANQVP